MAEDSFHLIQRMTAGDRQAFSRFYDLFSPLAYSFALRILRSKEEADDLLQEVFLQAWKQAGQYDPSRGKPEAWIITMVKSRAIDKLRSFRRRNEKASQLEEIARTRSLESEKSAGVQSQRKLTLENALSGLSGIQQEALKKAYFEGKTQTEIAEELGVPVGTIKTRIRDGLLKLKEQFSSQGETFHES